MDHTIENKVFERMKKAKRGMVFFTGDFVAYGNAKACNKALERLTKQEKIMRVGRGVYTIPQKSKFLGKVTPGVETIAQGIARRDKARIIPTGIFAENLLGLSTQVPIKIVYLTDGSARKLKIDTTSLIFKKVSPKNFATWGKISTLVIQALKSVGKEHVTEDIINKIVAVLKKETPQNLANDIKFAPSWIREIMRNALNNS